MKKITCLIITILLLTVMVAGLCLLSSCQGVGGDGFTDSQTHYSTGGDSSSNKGSVSVLGDESGIAVEYDPLWGGD